VDNYTKTMLIVIAFALCVLAGQNLVKPVEAQLETVAQRVVVCSDETGSACGIPVPVLICDPQIQSCANVVENGGQKSSADDRQPVRCSYEEAHPRPLLHLR
jgi:hypothetical protein